MAELSLLLNDNSKTLSVVLRSSGPRQHKSLLLEFLSQGPLLSTLYKLLAVANGHNRYSRCHAMRPVYDNYAVNATTVAKLLSHSEYQQENIRIVGINVRPNAVA